MFGRNSNQNQPPQPGQMPQQAPRPAHTQSSPPPVASTGGQSGRMSLIGNDLAIIGQKITVVSQGAVQIDGNIDGNVNGKEVIVGDNGSVQGTITANAVQVRGSVSGAIQGSMVTLHSSARVDGDIKHQSLAIAEGAQFDGRVRRSDNTSELAPTLDVDVLRNELG